MPQYIIRLDDASEYMDTGKWMRMEALLDKYNISPIFGVIPHNEDPDMIKVYPKDENFWDRAKRWCEKGWQPALHGYSHVFCTNKGGINPVNNRSEFAGLPLKQQREKIEKGYQILLQHEIKPEIFFAPAHTFDENTLKALEQKTAIRIINDTVANNVYYKEPFFFIPQQAGRVRKLPFKIVTFCYHPNSMKKKDYMELEHFLKIYYTNFTKLACVDVNSQRKKTVFDCVLSSTYFFRVKRRNLARK